MNTEWFPEVSKQTLITRLASLNAAVSFLGLISDTPAAVTIEEVLAVAAHFEGWAWRDLAASDTAATLVDGPPPTTHAQDTPAAPAEAPASLAVSPPAAAIASVAASSASRAAVASVVRPSPPSALRVGAASPPRRAPP